MDPTCRLIRQLHCRSTHHRFAIDALSHLRTDAGKRLAKWLLRYYPHYLRGAVDPDVRFRDFHNHLVHVRDGGWGGAPRVAHQWYRRLQKSLRKENFISAAHAAGVLTHYVSDVVQPLHTISDPREAIIHRPLEWSVTRNYEQILACCDRQRIEVNLTLADDPAWLGSMMLHAAHRASQHADLLTQRYRLKDAFRPGDFGLDQDSIEIFAELFAISLTLIAAVLDRAAAEAESYTGYPLPNCHPTIARCHAAVTAPIGLVKSLVKNASDRGAVKSIVRESRSEGRLTESLPAEIDIKQRVIEVYRLERQLRTIATDQPVAQRAA
ncbi:zinc dependent phospholipase C family protein [Roseiconus lacunae]|uniref:Zinc dependent phospholipase C family protein n=1 Tax=Roseiconus lacunae TaxID=2605694 RepID=A0ABT7PLR9_9BACT|nr:zinc dependent phospholipase C family protein [Roseiconus lacunae]MDM4017436.1 zinc dependent phospholipase C family protein [Roseiconus lacunae]